MRKRAISVTFATIMMSSLSMGAELPKEWIGNYVDSGDQQRCSAPNAQYDIMPLSIAKNYINFSTVAGCSVSKITQTKKGIFSVQMVCASEGEESKQSSIVEETKNGIKIDGIAYDRCPTTQTSIKPKRECKVIEGAAGVTTFTDEKLKKTGHTIRDWEPFVFQASSNKTINKIDILVGELYYDGKLVEKRSYAYADEWECKE